MKALYDSPWHHPFAAWVAGLLLLFVVARRLPFLYGYLVVFLVAILADAVATGAWSPIPLGTRAYTAFSVLFIVLGDLRYFVLAERVSHPERPLARVLALTVPLSLLVPITTGALTKVVPAMQDDRVLYVVYETALGLLTLGFDRWRVAHTGVREDVRTWMRRVSLLFAGLYFGWAFCDVLLLAGIEAGHLLRIVPNLLYYAAFLPFVYWSAPASARAFGPPPASARAVEAELA